MIIYHVIIIALILWIVRLIYGHPQSSAESASSIQIATSLDAIAFIRSREG